MKPSNTNYTFLFTVLDKCIIHVLSDIYVRPRLKQDCLPTYS